MRKNGRKNINLNYNALDKSNPYYNITIERHSQALKHNKNFYIDPETGHKVFTSKYLLNQNKCCKNNCRHCPYK